MPSYSDAPSASVPRSEIAGFLSQVPLFRKLRAGEPERLAAISTETALAAGEVVFAAGAPADALYVVFEGEVALYREGRSEVVRALARLVRGDFFGEMGLVEGGRRRETARATQPSVVLAFERRELLDFLDDHPVIALKLEMAAARGHSTKAAAALASAERRTDRIRVNQDVTLRDADSSSLLAKLIDISKAGLCLAGVPAAWQPEHRVPFHILWGDRALRFFGRVAWRTGKTVGIELEDRTPERDAWIDRVLQQMLAEPAWSRVE